MYRSRTRAGVLAVGVLAGAAGCFGPENEVEAPPFHRSDAGLINVGMIDAGFLVRQPQFGPAHSAADPPPAISGGTLLVTKDGRFAVASDPDRDLLHVVDLGMEAKVATLPLLPHDEPGRLVEDDAGRVHVALRRGGSVVTLARNSEGHFALSGRREVCLAPRGIDFDPSGARLLVGCAEGHVALLPADPLVNMGLQTWPVEADVRDVAVTDEAVFVSLFRTPHVWVLGKDGTKRQKVTLQANVFSGVGAKAGTLWRMQKRAGEVVVLFQQANTDGVSTAPGGYGGGGGCGAIVSTAVARIGVQGQISSTALLADTVLSVDFALSPDKRMAAFVAPGNAATPGLDQRQVQLLSVSGLAVGGCQGSSVFPPFPAHPDAGFPLPPMPAFPPDAGVVADAGVFPVADPPGLPPPEPVETVVQQPRGEAIAVALAPGGRTLVQIRQPAGLMFSNSGKVVSLSEIDRKDSGHEVFHSNAGAGIACASCHPEGGEDAHTWTFLGLGPRRTQSLRGGIMNTAPFHWNGELPSLQHLMGEVFQKRMQGPQLLPGHVNALAHFMDSLPGLPAKRSNADAAALRGRALFESPATGCVTCHSGVNTTNNASMNVGTGELFQVPSLKGVSWRAPFMHNGCADTLSARFSAGALCSGGDQHGAVSTLSPEQIQDLVAYMETL